MRFADGERAKLAYPPPAVEVVVAVHRLALRAPASEQTLATCLDEHSKVRWVGAVDERMLLPLGMGTSPRPAIRDCLLQGEECWRVIRPGFLTAWGVPNPYMNVCGGDRPWVVVGELSSHDLLAVPLNDGRGNPKWFTPQIEQRPLLIRDSKLSQLELAHLWSFPRDVTFDGSVHPDVHLALGRATVDYYS